MIDNEDIDNPDFHMDDNEGPVFQPWVIKVVKIMIVGAITIAAFACLRAGNAHGEIIAEQLRQNRAEQQALINLQHPMRMATAEQINYEIWKLTQERVQITQERK